MSASNIGLSASLTPTKHYGSAQKKSRVHQFRLPGLGRIAVTRDQGDAELFSSNLLDTNLHAIVREPDGNVVFDENLGSGLVTNVGVLALAVDFGVPAPSGAPANLLANAKFHAWGSKETAAATTDVKLTKYEAPTATECVEGTNSLGTASGTGAPKLLSVAKIKAESTLEIKEWGLHTQKVLDSGALGTGKLTAETATTGKASAAVFTASSTTVKGETLKIALATEASEIWGLITSNTTEVLTVPAWYAVASGAKTEPSATSKYSLKPVLWDHKVFTTIGVETGNEVEFKYELEIKSGG